MPEKATTRIFAVILICTAMLISACAAPRGGSVSIDWGDPSPEEPARPAVSKPTGPPSHAPAYGYRAKHRYRYYPNESIYFDTGRRLYFYLDGGDWRIAVSLPGGIRLSNDYVTLELETDKPYEHYDEHKDKYPPGQMKKKGKRKEKQWAMN